MEVILAELEDTVPAFGGRTVPCDPSLKGGVIKIGEKTSGQVDIVVGAIKGNAPITRELCATYESAVLFANRIDGHGSETLEGVTVDELGRSL